MQAKTKNYGDSSQVTIVLAHGAGAGMDSEFMQAFATGLAHRGFSVVLFEFPYMIKRREDGKKRPPDRAPKLIDYYRDLLRDLAIEGRVIIGGKSMGGRIASMLLAEDEAVADGLLLLGYPFSPPGKPEKLRTEHFANIKKPTLIIQGERDVFGGQALVERLILPENFDVVWSEDGDHSFKPRKASGRTESQNWQTAMDSIAEKFLETRAI